jgi:hypothetical protein
LFFSLQLVAQENCGDPGGCSLVSFAAFQHIGGVVKFGNTSGKVFLKKKRTLCTDASCDRLFTMTTALVAPIPTTASSIRSAIEPAQVTIVAHIRELDTTKSRLLGISFDGFLDDAKASSFKTAANLNSGNLCL